MSRKWRTGGLVGLAILITSIAAITYLRPPVTTRPTASTATFCCDQSLVTSDVVDYNFISATTGWAVVQREIPPSDGRDRFWIFRTADGGKHWRQLVGWQTGTGGPAIHSLQFFDQNHGFVFVWGQPDWLYRTTDGGAHWSSPSLPDIPRLGGINFSDAKNGWLLSGPPNRLYRTIDGGDTWRQLPDPPADASTITVRDANEGWLGSAGLGVPHVYHSTDGGRSWHRSDLGPPGLDLAGWISPTSVELVPRAGVMAWVGSSIPFISFDAGTTWRIPHVPGAQVSFQDASHWWSVQWGDLFKSDDAGQSWTPITDPSQSWRRVIGLVPNVQYIARVLDAKHAWAVIIVDGVNGLAVTSDGGVNWTRVPVPHII